MNTDCSQHKKEVAGVSDMKELATMIGDLHYETLSNLLFELQTKFHNDSISDYGRGRFKLGHSLHRASKWMFEASNAIETAWLISKPYMLKQQGE